MDQLRTRKVDLRFQHRERERSSEFSPIWKGTLDAVFTDVAPYYDIASDFASLGLCSRWRRRFVTWVDIGSGDRVLDVCAGTNGVGIALLRRQPDLNVFAIDRSAVMQEVGQQRVRARGFRIKSFIDDVHELPFDENSFDVVTLQFASRHLRVVDVFSEIHRVLKPGGRFYHCDMLKPENPVVARLYNTYLKACVSGTAFAFRSGSEARSCVDYFVRAIELFYSAAELSELLDNIGYSDVACQSATGGIVASHRGVKR